MPFHTDGKKEEGLLEIGWIIGFNLGDSLQGRPVERLFAFQRSSKSSYVPLIDDVGISPIKVFNQRYFKTSFH
jgi:hypothetical protein